MTDSLAVGAMPTVWVIIPTFNRQATLRACLQSLVRQAYPQIMITVVDDASGDGTSDMLRTEFPEVATLLGDGNRWWSGSMNLGLAYVLPRADAADYVLSFNDDVLAEPDLIEQLVLVARDRSDLALVGSVAVCSENHTAITFAGTRIDWAKGIWSGKAMLDKDFAENSIQSDSLPGRGTLIPMRAVLKTGFYDDRMFPQYFGDEDFSLRAKANGYQLLVSRHGRLFSHVRMTGIGRHGWDVGGFLRSLFSVRSPNQLRRRAAFIARHCPPQWRLSFWAIDVIKVISSFPRRVVREVGQRFSPRI